MMMNGNFLPGVRMGEHFYETLYAPLELKAFVSNESRLEHGKRVIVSNPRKASRTFSLEFQIVGATELEFAQNLEALYAELYTGSVVLEVPEVSGDEFHLVYLGKSSTYSCGLSRRACKVTVSFEEYNPAVRESGPVVQ